jgi:hypothetical protein
MMATHIRRRYSSSVELGVPLLGGTEGWDEGEAASLHWPVSTAQTMLVRENGTYGGQGKAVGRRRGQCWRLCCLSKRALSYFDIDQRRCLRCCCWIMA